MEPTQTFSVIAAAVGGLGALYIVVKKVWLAVSQPITVKRKDTGKTIILSKERRTNDARKLLDLVH